MTPIQPSYQSSPRLSTGRQACTAIDRRAPSVSSSPWAPCISFSARNRIAKSRSRANSSAPSPLRKGNPAVTRCHSAGSIRVRERIRRRRQERMSPTASAPRSEYQPGKHEHQTGKMVEVDLFVDYEHGRQGAEHRHQGLEETRRIGPDDRYRVMPAEVG